MPKVDSLQIESVDTGNCLGGLRSGFISNQMAGFTRRSRSLPGNSRRRGETVAHCAGVNEWIGANLM